MAKFVDHNNRELEQDEDGDGNENGKTAIALGQKTINMHVHHAFVHFSDVRARLGHETS